MKEIEEAILKEVDRLKDIIKLVPYDLKVNFPNMVTPGTILNFYDDDHIILRKVYDKQLASVAIFFNQLDIPLIELIDNFLDEVKKRELDLKYAKPLPHLDYSFVFYRPVLINHCPARLICSYDLCNQGWRLSLDTIIPGRTWRDDPLL
jgi:hypothetical protein